MPDLLCFYPLLLLTPIMVIQDCLLIIINLGKKLRFVPVKNSNVFSRTEDETLVESAKNTGKRWAKLAGVLGVAGVSYVGLFHVMLGGYELSPQICPRTLSE